VIRDRIAVSILGRNAHIFRNPGQGTAVMIKEEILYGAGRNHHIAFRIVIHLAVSGDTDIKCLRPLIVHGQRHGPIISRDKSIDCRINSSPAILKRSRSTHISPGNGPGRPVSIHRNASRISCEGLVIGILGRDHNIVRHPSGRGPVMGNDKMVDPRRIEGQGSFRIIV